jgi:hypothetical protein
MAKKSKDFRKTIDKLKEAQIQSVEQNLMGYTAAEKKVYDNIKKAVEALPAEQVIKGDVPIPEMVKLEMPNEKDESLSKIIKKLEKDLNEVKEELKDLEQQDIKNESKPTATKVEEVDKKEPSSDNKKVKKEEEEPSSDNKKVKKEEEEPSSDNKKVKEYKFADKIRRYSVGDLIAENIIQGKSIKDSIKGAIGTKTQATFTDIKKKFDPLNIAKSVGGRGASAIFGKILGRDQSELEYFSSRYRRKSSRASQIGDEKTNTATKISKGGVELGGNSTAILGDIYAFMQKNREDDIKQRELENDKKQEEYDLKEKRHKELLAALAKLTGAPIGSTAKSEPGGGGIIDTVLDTLGGMFGVGALKKLASKGLNALKGGAKTAIGSAEGLVEGAAKSATKVSKFLESAKGVLKFLEKIPGLSLIAAGAALIYDVKTAIDKNEAGEISDQELRKEIIGAVGGGLGGLGGAEVGGLLGGSIGSVVPGAGTLVGGILGGAAGFFGGEKLGKYAAEKMFDYFASGKDADPPADPQGAADGLKKEETKTTPAAATAPAMPTATTVPSQSGGGSTPASTPGSAPSSMSSPTSVVPTPTPNAGQKLNASTQMNQSMKLDNAIPKNKTSVVNNTSVAGQGRKGLSYADPEDTSKLPMGNIRNKDPTYERVTLYNTRVV